MLSKLFGSKARVKILKLFLLHPDRKYYIRQLSRDLRLQVNSVRRELENLEELGLLISNISTEDENENKEEPDSKILEKLKQGIIVKSRKKENKEQGNLSKGSQSKKYFQANENFVLFEEIRALIAKAQVLYEKNFIDKLQKVGKIKLFILSGVFVGNQDSAVDIFLVGRFNRQKFLKLIKELEKELDYELKYTMMDTQEFNYRNSITDTFLYGILEGRKAVIIDKIGIGR